MADKFPAPFLFIHNPKTGGLSVQAFIAKFPHLSGAVRGHFTLKQHQRRFGTDICSTVPIFSIIRNPLDRLVSAYHFGLRIFDEPRMQDRFYRSIREEYFTNTKGFDEFARKVCARGMSSPDCWPEMLRPQRCFIEAIDGSLPAILWPFENLGGFVRYIRETYTSSADDEAPVVNQSKHGHFLDYYSPELVRMVEQMYPQDFALYEQVIEPPQL